MSKPNDWDDIYALLRKKWSPEQIADVLHMKAGPKVNCNTCGPAPSPSPVA